MTEPGTDLTGSRPYRSSMAQPVRSSAPANLADILERVLDKGIVIAGDIRVNLLDIELLTIKIRLLVASVDKAQEIGLDWWRYDRDLSPGAARDNAGEHENLRAEIRQLQERVEALTVTRVAKPRAPRRRR